MKASSKTKSKVKPIEIIPKQLYWVSDKKEPKSSHSAYYFNIDKALVYTPFAYDFGPLNLAMVHRF